MATTNITITSSDTNNNSVQKTITGINPDATSAQLVSAAQKIVALTDNTYVKTDRVDKTNCDTEASGKQTPTLTLANPTITMAPNEVDSTAYTYDGDGEILLGTSMTSDDAVAVYTFSNQSIPKGIAVRGMPTAKSTTIKVIATETANYKSAEVTLNVIITA